MENTLRKKQVDWLVQWQNELKATESEWGAKKRDICSVYCACHT